MKKGLIITSYIEHQHALDVSGEDYDLVICADGGLVRAKELGLSPDLLIGDYDSTDRPDEDVILLPMEKDMTDSEAAIDLAVSEGCDHITVLGGLGGRFDHTMGNIGMLARYCGKGAFIRLLDGQNEVFMLPPGEHTIARDRHKYLGLIAYGGACEGLTLQGTKYTLKDFTLTDDTTRGVSNEFVSEEAVLSFQKGKLLVIRTGDIR